jgi:hypothetical protein
MNFQASLRPDRIAYLAAAALFLSFLLYSAPHQVHHAFQPRHATPCIAFSIVKSCHLDATAAVDLLFARSFSGRPALTIEISDSHSTLAAVSQRAPPSA